MDKLVTAGREIVLCGLPFAWATFLCLSTLKHTDNDMRFWEPAFYSFLPMTFFFVGVALYFSRRDVRELRATVEALRPTIGAGNDNDAPVATNATVTSVNFVPKSRLYRAAGGWIGILLSTEVQDLAGLSFSATVPLSHRMPAILLTYIGIVALIWVTSSWIERYSDDSSSLFARPVKVGWTIVIIALSIIVFALRFLPGGI